MNSFSSHHHPISMSHDTSHDPSHGNDFTNTTSTAIMGDHTPIKEKNPPPIHWKLNTSTSTDSTRRSSSPSPRASLTKDNVFTVERLIHDLKTKELGTLEITTTDVIFTEGRSASTIHWPLMYLRRYGYENEIFTLEAGRKCAGGEGLYAFRSFRASEINSAIKMMGNGNKSSNDRYTTPLSATPTMEVNRNHTSYSMSPVHPRSSPAPPPPPPLSPPPSPSLPPPSSLKPPLRRPPLPPPTLSNSVNPELRSSGTSDPLLPPPPPPPTSRSPQHDPRVRAGSPPIFKKSDSLLRRAFSASDLRPNIFEVRNISDDKKEVGEGTVEVTATDLIYIDSKTHEKWRWPFKFLRKYGYEDHIFSFEAGRRCAGGQGLYAFASKQANEIHEAIVGNIHGRKQKDSSPPHPLMNPRHSMSHEKLGLSPSFPPLTSSSSSSSVARSSHDGDVEHNLPGKSSPLHMPRATPPPLPSALLDSLNQHHQQYTQHTALHTTSPKPPPTSLPNAPPMSPPKSLPPFLKARCQRTISSPVINIGSTPFPGSAPWLGPSHTTDVKSASPHAKEAVQHTSEPIKRVFHSEHLYDVPDRRELEGDRDHTPSHVHTRSLDGGRGDINQDDAYSIGHSPVANGNDLGEPRRNHRHNNTEGENATPSNRAAGGAGPEEEKRKKTRGGGEEKKKKNQEAGKHSVLHFLTLGKSKRKGKKNGGKGKALKKDLVANDGGGGGDGDPMYQNVNEAKISKMPYSASCDDILSSYDESRPNSYSMTPSSVPQPVPQPLTSHRDHTPPLRPHSATDYASIYQNFTILSPTKYQEGINNVQQVMPTSVVDMPTDLTDSAPIYSNVTLREEQEREGGSISSYAELEIIDQRPTFKKMVTKKPSLPLIRVKTDPHSIPDGGVGERQRSRSLFPNSDTVDMSDDPVTYAPLNFKAMEVVEKMRRERADISNFDGILKRHDIRDMEHQRRVHT